jgi:cytochrome c oxidase cbb3-type subunit 4
MTFTLFQSLWSIVILITFLGIVFWAYSSKRTAAFDEAARLPFDDEPPSEENKPSSSAKQSSPPKISRSR